MITDQLHIFWTPTGPAAGEGLHYWSFVSGNGRILADGAQGYVERRDALHGFAILNRAHVGPVPAEEREQPPCIHHDRVCQVWPVPRRDLDHVTADALRHLDLACPQHGGKCAPPCRFPEYLRNQVAEHARRYDDRSTTR